VTVGDSRSQKVMGQGTIYFYIGQRRFDVEAVIIKNWAHNVLLSVQWLREHKALIDVEELNIWWI